MKEKVTETMSKRELHNRHERTNRWRWKSEEIGGIDEEEKKKVNENRVY